MYDVHGTSRSLNLTGLPQRHRAHREKDKESHAEPQRMQRGGDCHSRAGGYLYDAHGAGCGDGYLHE
jgi:hypothetical protein